MLTHSFGDAGTTSWGRYNSASVRRIARQAADSLHRHFWMKLSARPYRVHRASLFAEPLESRQYLTSVTLTGSSAATSFEVRLDSAGQNVDFYQNDPQLNDPTQVVPLSQLSSITVIGKSGNDTLTVDFSNGNPIPSGGLNFGGAASGLLGGNKVYVDGTGSGDQLALAQGQATFSSNTIASAAISYSNTESVLLQNQGGGLDTLEVNQGTYLFNEDLGAADPGLNVSVANGATLQFAQTQHLGALTISAGGMVQMLPEGGQVLEIESLTDAGTLDLADNDMVVHDDSLSAINALIAQGYNQGQWNGSGITSSTAAADDRALGVVLNNTGSGATLLSSVDGQSVTNTDVVVEYTCYGDANLDGTVDAADFVTLSNNFGASNATWQQGDFNYDGSVSIADYILLSNNFGATNRGSPTNVTIGQDFALTPSNYSPGSSVLRWDVSWGDGDYDSYDSTQFSQASHVYTSTGPVTLAVTAVCSDGSIYRAPLQPLAIQASSSGTAEAVDPAVASDVSIALDNTGQNVIVTEITTGSDPTTTTDELSLSTLLSLSIGGDAQSLTVDFSNGDPIPIGGLSFSGSSIEVIGDSQSDAVMADGDGIDFQNSSMSSPAVIRHNSTATVKFSGSGTGDVIAAVSGTLILAPAAGTALPTAADTTFGPTAFVGGGATLLLDGTQQLSGLNVADDGTARIDTAGNSTLTTASLILAPSTNNQPGGVLDLADNDLIVQEGDLATINGYLAAGYDNGAWDGLTSISGEQSPAAIISDVAQADTSETEELQAASVGDDGAPQAGTFNGEPVAMGDVVVNFTYYGLSGVAVSATVDTPFTGDVAEFFSNDQNNTGEQYTATIDWGDGNISAGTVQPDGYGDFFVSGTNTYSAEGNYTINVTIGNQSSPTVTTTTTAAVSTLTVTGTSLSPTQGVTFDGTVATFTDTAANTSASSYTATIEWGDGTVTAATVTGDTQDGYTLSGSHTYTVAGDFDALITVTDADGGIATADADVEVAGIQATTTPVTATAGQGFTGEVADFSDTAADAASQSYSATINWGNNDSSSGTIVSDGEGGFTVSGADAFANPGVFNVTVTIDASDGRTATATTTANISGISATGDTITGVQGQTYSGPIATFTSLIANTTAASFTAEIDWGDGNTSIGTIASDGNGGFIVSGANTFAAAGALQPVIVITDPTGASADVTATANVAGVVATAQTITATAGQNFSGVLATFSDTAPNTSANTYTATIDWGNGSPTIAATVTPDTNGDGGYSVSGSYTFSQVGTFDPTVVITASDGNTATVEVEADVADPPITADGTSITATQNASFTGTVATFSQNIPSSTADDYSATIDWGDGGTSDGTITPDNNGDGGYTVTGTYTYSMPASYTITVTIEHGDGTTATATSGATVAAVPVVPQINDSAVEGSPYTLDLADIAGNISGINSWTINWGDGSAGDPDIQTIQGNPDSVQWTFATGTVSPTVIATALDVNGTTLTSSSITVAIMPQAPTNLAATWNNDGSLTLSWTNSSAIAPSVTILESVDNGQTFTVTESVPASPSSCTLTGLDPTTQYCFELMGNTAADGSGTSGQPALVTAQPISTGNDNTTGTQDDAVTGSAAPAITLKAAAGTAPDSVVLTWTTSDGSSETGFELEEEDESAGTNYVLIQQPGSANSSGTGTTTLTGLNDGDEYSFRIREDESTGISSPYTFAAFTPSQELAGAPILSVTAVSVPQNQQAQLGIGLDLISATFPPADASEYILEGRGGIYPGPTWHEYMEYSVSGSPTIAAAGQLTLSDITFENCKQLRVCAVTSNGQQSPWSNICDVPVPASAGSFFSVAPPILNVVLEPDGPLVVTVTNFPTEPMPTQIQVESNNDLYQNYIVLPLSPNQPTYITIPGRGASAYFLSAQFVVGGQGGSLWSSDFSVPVLTGQQVPTAPDGIGVAIDPSGDGNLQIHWHNSSYNESGFVVQRRPSAGGNWQTIGTTNADQTELEYTPPGGSDDWVVPYDYRVYATNGAGSSTAAEVDNIAFAKAALLKVLQSTSDEDKAIGTELGPVLSAIAASEGKAQFWLNALRLVNASNAQEGAVQVFSPLSALTASLSVGSTLTSALTNSGPIQRTINGFAALSSSVKALVKASGDAAIFATVVQYGIDRSVTVWNISAYAQLLDAVSICDTGVETGGIRLAGYFSEAMHDGAAVDDRMSAVQSMPDGEYLVSQYWQAKAALTALKNWHSSSTPNWQAISSLCQQLNSQISSLSSLVNLGIASN